MQSEDYEVLSAARLFNVSIFALSSPQDRSRVSRSRNLRCGNYNNSLTESDYDVVDDQKEVLNVCILPARPIHGEQEYAG